jgi:hypothetical protein
MPLRSGGAPALIRRDLGTPGAIGGAWASGSALYGARRTSPLIDVVRMRGGDGAARIALTQGGASGLGASLLPGLAQSAQAVATVPGYASAASTVLPGLSQAASAAATGPGGAAVAASVLPALGQGAVAAATAPGFPAVAASVLPALGQGAVAVATAPGFPAGAASILPQIGQGAIAVAAGPGFPAVAASVLPVLGQAASAGAGLSSGPVVRAALRLTRPVVVGLRLVRLTQVRVMFEGRPVGQMQDVMQGEAVRIDLRFADAAGAPIVVSGAALRAKPPSGEVRSYALTAGPATGEWAATVLFDLAGRWWIEGECTSPSPAVTPSLLVVVRPRAAPPP